MTDSQMTFCKMTMGQKYSKLKCHHPDQEMTSIMPNESKHPKLLNICYDISSNDISPKDNWSMIMTSLVPNISNTFNTLVEPLTYAVTICQMTFHLKTIGQQ